MAIDLYPHKPKAYNYALKNFEETNKIAIIHPVDTEKAIVVFELCKVFPAKTICLFSFSE